MSRFVSRKVSNVVLSELALNSIFGLRKGTGHDGCIVNYDADFLHACTDGCSSLSYRGLAAEIKRNISGCYVGVSRIYIVDYRLDL